MSEENIKREHGRSRKSLWIILMALVLIILAGIVVVSIVTEEAVEDDEQIEVPYEPDMTNSILSDSHAAARLKGDVRDKAGEYFMEVADSIQSYTDSKRFSKADYRQLFDMITGTYIYVTTPEEYSRRYSKYSEVSRRQLISEQAAGQLKELVIPAWREYAIQYNAKSNTSADVVNSGLSY